MNEDAFCRYGLADLELMCWVVTPEVGTHAETQGGTCVETSVPLPEKRSILPRAAHTEVHWDGNRYDEDI